MSSCEWFPISRSEIRAWIREHPEALPATLADISRFPMAFRRIFVNEVSPDVRLRLWLQHFETFLRPEAGLTEQQRDMIVATAAEMPQLLAAPAPNPTIIDWERRAAMVFFESKGRANLQVHRASGATRGHSASSRRASHDCCMTNAQAATLGRDNSQQWGRCDDVLVRSRRFQIDRSRHGGRSGRMCRHFCRPGPGGGAACSPGSARRGVCDGYREQSCARGPACRFRQHCRRRGRRRGLAMKRHYDRFGYRPRRAAVALRRLRNGRGDRDSRRAFAVGHPSDPRGYYWAAVRSVRVSRWGTSRDRR